MGTRRGRVGPAVDTSMTKNNDLTFHLSDGSRRIQGMAMGP